MKFLGSTLVLLVLAAGCANKQQTSDRDPANKCWRAQCSSTNDFHTKSWRGVPRRSIEQAERDAKDHDKTFHNGLRTAQVIEVDCQ